MGSMIGTVHPLLSFGKGLTTDKVFALHNPLSIVSGDHKVWQSIANADEAYASARLYPSWKRTRDLRPNDFNGTKVSLRGLTFHNSALTLHYGATDYFTLWGLPAANKEVHEQSIQDLVNRLSTELPVGVATDNILLLRPEGSEQLNVLMKVSSSGAGFAAGRAAMTIEEQVELTDGHPFATPVRAYKEELGLEVKPEDVRLLGVCMQTVYAYAGLGFVTTTTTSEETLLESWKGAKDYNEATALFVVPVVRLGEWLQDGGVKPDVWEKYASDTRVASGAALQLHPTVLWRATLLKEYLEANSFPTWS